MNIGFNSLLFVGSVNYVKIKTAQVLSPLQRKIAIVAIACLICATCLLFIASKCLSNKVQLFKKEEPDPKNVPERLKKNLDFAKAQQLKEREHPKNFKLHQDELPVNFNFCNEHAAVVQERPVGIAGSIGPRPSMEDSDFSGVITPIINGESVDASVFGVFDGHGGAGASAYVRDNLKKYLTVSLEMNNHTGLTDEGIWEALKECCINLDADYPNDHDGTTATIAIILNDKLWVGNVGDSRTILSHDDGAIQLSEDACPEIDRYKKTVEKLGGMVWHNPFVESDYRVNGRIAVARAIGDKEIVGHDNVQCCISPHPKITCFPMSDIKNGYLILACDGLYDVSTTDEVSNSIQTMANLGMDTLEMAKRLVYSALACGSRDNVSVMVVKL